MEARAFASLTAFQGRLFTTCNAGHWGRSYIGNIMLVRAKNKTHSMKKDRTVHLQE